MKDHELFDLYDLLLEQLRDLYDGERQQLKTLPSFNLLATSPDLQEMISSHERETRHQLQRLEEVFDLLEEDPNGKNCDAIKGLVKEFRKLIDRCKIEEVLDAALITSVQHINHYEIASYGTAISYAKALEFHDIAELLLDTLREKKHADMELSDVAEDHINGDATWTSLISRIKK